MMATQREQTARQEIIDVADKYPAYAAEIMEMVAQYRGMEEGGSGVQIP